MRERWTGGLLGVLAVLAVFGLARVPLGWAAATALAAFGGWFLGGYIQLIRHQADHDDLTGVMNRRPFERTLPTVCQQQPVSLLFIEMDDFGQINKRYNHMVGDQALLSVCRLLEQNTRRSDLLARWGGDEFVLLLPGTDPDSALRLAERIRATVAATPYRQGDVTIALSVSTGVAALTSAGGSPADLLRRAEQAHRIAKQRKNAVHLCS